MRLYAHMPPPPSPPSISEQPRISVFEYSPAARATGAGVLPASPPPRTRSAPRLTTAAAGAATSPPPPPFEWPYQRLAAKADRTYREDEARLAQPAIDQLTQRLSRCAAELRRERLMRERLQMALHDAEAAARHRERESARRVEELQEAHKSHCAERLRLQNRVAELELALTAQASSAANAQAKSAHAAASEVASAQQAGERAVAALEAERHAHAAHTADARRELVASVGGALRRRTAWRSKAVGFRAWAEGAATRRRALHHLRKVAVKHLRNIPFAAAFACWARAAVDVAWSAASARLLAEAEALRRSLAAGDAALAALETLLAERERGWSAAAAQSAAKAEAAARAAARDELATALAARNHQLGAVEARRASEAEASAAALYAARDALAAERSRLVESVGARICRRMASREQARAWDAWVASADARRGARATLLEVANRLRARDVSRAYYRWVRSARAAREDAERARREQGAQSLLEQLRTSEAEVRRLQRLERQMTPATTRYSKAHRLRRMAEKNESRRRLQFGASAANDAVK